MDAGIDRKSIKLHGVKLYVNSQIQGQILNDVFVQCSSISNQSSGTTLEPVQLPSANSHTDHPNDSCTSLASVESANFSPSK